MGESSDESPWGYSSHERKVHRRTRATGAKGAWDEGSSASSSSSGLGLASPEIRTGKGDNTDKTTRRSRKRDTLSARRHSGDSSGSRSRSGGGSGSTSVADHHPLSRRGNNSYTDDKGGYMTNVLSATWSGSTRYNKSRAEGRRTVERGFDSNTSSSDPTSGDNGDPLLQGYTERSERVQVGLSERERRRLLKRANVLSRSHDDAVLRSALRASQSPTSSAPKSTRSVGKSAGSSKKYKGSHRPSSHADNVTPTRQRPSSAYSVRSSQHSATRSRTARSRGNGNDRAPDTQVHKLQREVEVVKRSKDSLHQRLLGELTSKDKRIAELEKKVDMWEKRKDRMDLTQRNQASEVQKMKELMESERRLWYKELKQHNYVSLPIGDTPAIVPILPFQAHHSREYWTPPATAVLERRDLGMPTTAQDVSVDGLSFDFVKYVLALEGIGNGGPGKSFPRAQPPPHLKRTSSLPSSKMDHALRGTRARSHAGKNGNRVSSTRSALDTARARQQGGRGTSDDPGAGDDDPLARSMPIISAARRAVGLGVGGGRGAVGGFDSMRPSSSTGEDAVVPGEGITPFVGAHGFTAGERRAPGGRHLAYLNPLWSAHAPDSQGHTLTLHDRRLRIARVGGGFVEVEEDRDGTAEVRELPQEARSKYREVKQERMYWEGMAGYFEELLQEQVALRKMDQDNTKAQTEELQAASTALGRLEDVVARILGSGINPDVVLQQAAHCSDNITPWERITSTLESLAGQIVAQNNEIDSLRAQIKHYQLEEQEREIFKRDCLRDAETMTEHVREQHFDTIAIDIIDETLDDMWEDIVLNAIHESKEESAQYQKELLYLPEPMEALIQTKVTQPRIRSLHSVLNTIRQLYIDKATSDAADDREGLERLILSDFVYESFTTRYGLQSLTDTHVVDFLASVNYHRPNSVCVRTFGAFLHELPTTSLNFYLFAYQSAVATYTGATFLDPDNGEMYIARPAAMQTAKEVLEGLGDDVIKDCITRLKKHKEWKAPSSKYAQAHASVVTQQAIDLFVFLDVLLTEHGKEEARRVSRLRKAFSAGERDHLGLMPAPAFKQVVRGYERVSKEDFHAMLDTAVTDTNTRRGPLDQVTDRIDLTAFITAMRQAQFDNRFRWGSQHRFIAGQPSYRYAPSLPSDM